MRRPRPVRMSSSSSSNNALVTGPGFPSWIGALSHSTIGATFTELPMSIISRAARASATGMSQTATPVMSCPLLQGRRELEQAPRRAPGQDVLEPRVTEHAIARDESHVHVRTLPDIPLVVDEDAVVEARLLGFHLHEHIR